MNTIVKNEWYTDFFAGINCEMWEKAVTNKWTEQEVNFLIDTLGIQPGDAVLDVPCGFGRHTVELAKQGYSMTGIDISAEFLQTLRARTTADQLPINIIQGDILTTPLTATFDGAYCLGNSFGYVSYEGMDVFVKKIADALKPGARFVINSGVVAESILPNFPKTGHYVLGDLVVDITNSYVVDESHMVSELTYTQNGRLETHCFKHYVYTLSEIKRLLAQYGLQTIALYNSTEKADYQLGDRQLYLVAEKS